MKDLLPLMKRNAVLMLPGMKKVSIDQMYGDWQATKEEIQSELDRSLNPRSSSSLFDTVESLGLGPEAAVLDIGARDARYSVTLHERFGGNVTAVEPVTQNVEEARGLVEESGHADHIEVRQGSIQEIPADDDIFDLVFCRDVLSHVPDLDAAFKECYRVTAGGGRMVVYQTFATDLMEPAETARICADLAVAPVSLAPVHLETEAENAGFNVESIDVIGSEWREAWEEDGTHRTSRQLLHAARLIRGKDRLQTRMGEIPYRVELANALWGVYQMIGKLEPRIYTLRKPGMAVVEGRT